MAELRHLNKADEAECPNGQYEEDTDEVLVETNVKPTDKRDQWSNRMEFLLAIIGFTVGIGSIWRFPIRCAQNGGGAFLIPFFFFMITCGGPLYYIEVCIGQFSGKSAAAAFDLCPLFKGVGLLMVLISFNILWYYVTIMGWIQYYFVYSFFPTVPWATCSNWWNTDACRESSGPQAGLITANQTSLLEIGDVSNSSKLILNNATNGFTSAATEFWQYNVLRKSSGLEDMGYVQWQLVLSNFFAWAIVVATVIKGVKSLGKVVYVTATAPYILLTVLLIRGLTLDGATEGVIWYLTPNFEKLITPQTWLEAAIQVFYSLGPTYGGVITMASHNKFRHKSILETYICVFSDAFTAFFAGLVVFSCLGFMAKESGSTIEEVASASGPGLAFVAYPEALSRMPFPQLWAVLFFLTLITVAFDSTFGMYETVTGALIDCYPRIFGRHKLFTTVGVALLIFILSTPLSMNGGIYLFQLSDWYISSFSLLFGSCLEAIIVCWIYGADRFSQDIELMTGRKSSVTLRVFWCCVLPSFLAIAFLVTIFTYTEPNYGDGYVYQPYAISIGFVMAFIPIAGVFLVMGKELYNAEGPILKRISTLLQPSENWQPNDAVAREEYRLRPYRYEASFFRRILANIRGDKDTPWF